MDGKNIVSIPIKLLNEAVMRSTGYYVPSIKEVIFNDPATIVYWDDGTKTVAKVRENDIFDKETGLAIAIAKKMLGSRNRLTTLCRNAKDYSDNFEDDPVRSFFSLL